MLLSAAALEAKSKELKRYTDEHPDLPLPVDTPHLRTVKTPSPTIVQGAPIAFEGQQVQDNAHDILEISTRNPAASPEPDREPEYDNCPLILNPDIDWRYSAMHFKPSKDTEIRIQELRQPIRMKKKYDPAGYAQGSQLPPPIHVKPGSIHTRRVFRLPEKERKVRTEERNKWVLEDGSGRQQWVGNMQATESSYVAFQKHEHSGQTHFTMTPIHQLYDFQPKNLLYGGRDVNEAHDQYTTRLAKALETAPYKSQRNGQVLMSLSNGNSKRTKRTAGQLREKQRLIDHPVDATLDKYARWLENADCDEEMAAEDDEDGLESSSPFKNMTYTAPFSSDRLIPIGEVRNEDAMEVDEPARPFADLTTKGKKRTRAPDDDDENLFMELFGEGRDTSGYPSKAHEPSRLVERCDQFIDDPLTAVGATGSSVKPRRKRGPRRPSKDKADSTHALPSASGSKKPRHAKRQINPSSAVAPGVGSALVAKRATSSKPSRKRKPSGSQSPLTQNASNKTRVPSPLAVATLSQEQVIAVIRSNGNHIMASNLEDRFDARHSSNPEAYQRLAAIIETVGTIEYVRARGDYWVQRIRLNDQFRA